MLSLKEALDGYRIIRVEEQRDIRRYSAEELRTNFIMCDGPVAPGLFTVETDADYDRERTKLLGGPTVHMRRVLAQTTTDGSILLRAHDNTYVVDIDIIHATTLKSAAAQIIDDRPSYLRTFIVAGDNPAEHEYALGLQYESGWTFVRIHRGEWSEEGKAEITGTQMSLLHHKLLM